MTENDISYKIRGAIYNVYNNLGPGLLESVYVAALMYELSKVNLNVNKEVAIPVYYEDIKLDVGYRMDILVENIAKVHHKQVLTYLKVTGLRLAILVNFNVENINEGVFRKVNNL